MDDSKINGYEEGDLLPRTSNSPTLKDYCLARFDECAPLESADQGSQPEGARSGTIPDARLTPKRTSSNRKKETRVGGLSIISVGDLLSEPPEEAPWQVEGLLPRGGVSIIGARPKVGKSTMARNLALCVARGAPFLNRATQPGPVGYLALEEKRSEVQRHFQHMGAVKEPIYVHVGMAPQDALTATRELITHYQLSLLIVDPLLRWIRVKDGNSYAEVTQAFERYVQLARSTNCHILFAHHMVKNDRTGAEGLLGSTAIFGAVDTAIILNCREQVRTIETSQRYGENLAPTVLTYDRTTGLLACDRTVTDHQHDALAAKVCAVLAHGPLNEADIRSALGGDQTEVAKAVRRLVEQEIVTRSGMGRKGSPYQYELAGKPAFRRSDSTEHGQPDEEPGWPEAIDGVGDRVTGQFARCVTCGAGTWNRYGETPLCLTHASTEAAKSIGSDSGETDEQLVEGGGNDDAGEA